MSDPSRPWKVRRVAPVPSEWTTVHAPSAIDAAQTLHMRSGRGCYLPSDAEHEDFAVIEVEGVGQLISRCFFAHGARAGTPAHPAPALDLADVARRLGVSRRLLEGEWAGEREHWEPRFSH